MFPTTSLPGRIPQFAAAILAADPQKIVGTDTAARLSPRCFSSFKDNTADAPHAYDQHRIRIFVHRLENRAAPWGTSTYDRVRWQRPSESGAAAEPMTKSTGASSINLRPVVRAALSPAISSVMARS
jgi:hypothetical protein